MFQENRITKNVDEEQITSTVSLTIVEIVKSGIIFKRSREFERDKIELEYDFRTGRWSGDDNFKDKDGYGYFLGDTFEIWFNIYQIDFDNDFIPYWTEVNVLGTDPRQDDSKQDPDSDGIPTAWEWKWGYDPFSWDDHEKLDPDMDGLENIEEYQTAKWFADPFAQDVYVEVDIMEGIGLLDKPRYFYEECQQAIIEKYAEHNIRLFYDDGWPDSPKNGGGDMLPAYKKNPGTSGIMLQFYNNYFPDERKGIFRYQVVGISCAFNFPSKGNLYDTICISYDPLLPIRPLKRLTNWFFKGITPTVRGERISIAAVAMHELGHSNGLQPWSFEGIDNNTYGLPLFPKKDYKYINYRSVMNYQCIYDTSLLDYSHGKNGPPYDQNDWENIIVAHFQYNDAFIEDPYFTLPIDPNLIIWGETEVGVNGYVYDENLTKDFIKSINGWSPIDRIQPDWMVFKLKEKNNNPDYKEIKIFVKPNNHLYADWAEYAEGELDSDGNILLYSQQKLIDDIMLEIS